MIRAGELKHSITFQAETVTYDTYNEKIPDWVSVATVRAAMITTGGKLFYAAQKLHAETSAVFQIYFSRAINGRMRIKYGSRIFNILGINNVDGESRELLISCKEVV